MMRTRIALLSNPNSTGNIAQLPRIRAFCADHPDIFHYEVEKADQVGEALKQIALVRPKILIINGRGRIEGDIFTILLLLRHLPKEHFDIYVVSKPRGEVYDQLKKLTNVTVIDMEIGGNEAKMSEKSNKIVDIIESGSALLKIAALVKKSKFDAIYTIDRGVDPKIAAIASAITGCPFVLCAAYPFYPNNGYSARFVLRQATRILVHSKYLYEHLLPYVKDPSRLVIIPYGIEIEKYDPCISGESIREQYNIKPEDPVIVMMGRLDQYKGQDDLIKAAKIVLQSHPNAHFLISGRGTPAFKSSLENLISDLDLSNHVRLVGYVPSLPQFIAASNIVAMPSWEEPFGLVALEGMAMAKPVISTKAGGVPEFVLDNELGLLVRPRDPKDLAKAILQLIADPQRAKEMGLKGRQQVERFYTVSQYAKCVTQTIENVITRIL